mgnify:CR=1 FL=1
MRKSIILKKEKRNYIGFEINKSFYETCLKRIKETKEE